MCLKLTINRIFIVDYSAKEKKTNLLFLRSLKSLFQYQASKEDLLIFQVVYPQIYVLLRILFGKIRDILGFT